MLRWFSSLLLLLMALAQSASAEKIATLPKPTGYIDDYAAVLSPDAKRQMEALCVELHQKTRAQVFVVTVGSLDNVSIELFANKLFNKWKIGEKRTNRGVLLLFAISERKYRIEVGYGFERILSNATADYIGQTMVPSLRTGDYDDAVNGGLDSVAQIIADDASVQLDGFLPVAPVSPAVNPAAALPSTPSHETSPWTVFLGVIGIFFLAVFVLVAMVVRANSGSWIGGYGTRWGNYPYPPNNNAGLLNVGNNQFGTGSGFGGTGNFTGDAGSSGSGSCDIGSSFSGGDGGSSNGGGATGSW